MGGRQASASVGVWRAARQRAVSLVAAGLITTGLAPDTAGHVRPDNVAVTRWARHTDVLPRCPAVICLYFIGRVGCGWARRSIGFGRE